MSELSEVVDINKIDFAYSFLSNVDPKCPPSTITISNKHMDLMSNMERQYWEIKRDHYDVLIFFKKGAFYELYDYDAVIGNKEFGLKLVLESSNRGKMRLAGVPEHSFTEWARLFVFRGYKVGRVEQMKLDEEPSPVKQKVMPRKLVQIITPATVTDLAMISDHAEIFLLALCPIFVDDSTIFIDAFALDLSRRVVYHCVCGENKSHGVVKMESDFTSAFTFSKNVDHLKVNFATFALESLTSLLQQLNPKEVIITAPDSKAQHFACDNIFKWVVSDGFRPEYVPSQHGGVSNKFSDFQSKSPAGSLLLQYLLSLCHEENELELLLEPKEYTAHLKSPDFTRTADASSGKTEMSLLEFERRCDPGMVLDANTVNNLEIVTNLQDGDVKQSLNYSLNHCVTNGGRRMFRAWLLRPVQTVKTIEARQEVVRFLYTNSFEQEWPIAAEDSFTGRTSQSSTADLSSSPSSQVTQLSPSSLPSSSASRKRTRAGAELYSCFTSLIAIDFERVLSRLAALKSSNSATISYVDPMVMYKKDLNLILTTVQGFSDLVQWSVLFTERVHNACERPPQLLMELLTAMTNCSKNVEAISKLFNKEAAETSGLLIPSPGTCTEYDEAVQKIDKLEEELHAARRRAQTDYFNDTEVSFTDMGKDLFLYEIPACAAPKTTPRNLVERSRTSKVVRYVDPSLSNLIESHKNATQAKSSGLLDVLRRVAERICDHSTYLYEASAALSYLDCLHNLSNLSKQWSATPNGSTFPSLVPSDNALPEANTEAIIEGKELVHPLLRATCTSNTTVANCVRLNNNQGRVLVLTGPNMAGKSTLMRTVAVNVLLAQLGGPVCGEEMILSPVDRIFTRIGARDASNKGQSTLFVELSETAEILRSATSRSLCLIDELGRGTSTHDGMAIAQATLEAIQQHRPSAPLTIFSTHYHSIALELDRTTASVANTTSGGEAVVQVKREKDSTAQRDDRSEDSRVQLGYMDFMLKYDTEGTAENHNGERKQRTAMVVFLYRLVSGVCDRSYGVEVARMAGVNEHLLELARRKSDELARRTAFHEDVQTLGQLMKSS